MPWKDTLEHMLDIDIPVADLARWEATAKRLEPVTAAVIIQISGLHSDPSKRRIGRAANAARYAANIADEPLKTEAVALAEELERWSV